MPERKTDEKEFIPNPKKTAVTVVHQIKWQFKLEIVYCKTCMQSIVKSLTTSMYMTEIQENALGSFSGF